MRQLFGDHLDRNPFGYRGLIKYNATLLEYWFYLDTWIYVWT